MVMVIKTVGLAVWGCPNRFCSREFDGSEVFAPIPRLLATLVQTNTGEDTWSQNCQIDVVLIDPMDDFIIGANRNLKPELWVSPRYFSK